MQHRVIPQAGSSGTTANGSVPVGVLPSVGLSIDGFGSAPPESGAGASGLGVVMPPELVGFSGAEPAHSAPVQPGSSYDKSCGRMIFPFSCKGQLTGCDCMPKAISRTSGR